jgi:hypothetical protein
VWVLTFSMVILHRFLFSAFVFHPRTPWILRFFSTLPSHRRLGLPALLVPSGFENISLLHGDVSFILLRCPSHTSLPSLKILTISGTLYKSYS